MPRLDRRAAGDDAHAVAVLRDARTGAAARRACPAGRRRFSLMTCEPPTKRRSCAPPRGRDEAQERARGARRCRPRPRTAGRRAATAPSGRRPRSPGRRRRRSRGPSRWGPRVRIQSSSVMPVPLSASLAFHGARDAGLLGRRVELGGGQDRLLHVGVVGEARDGGVQRAHAARDQDVGAAVVGREGLDSDRLRERQDAVLRGAGELAADLGDVPAAERAVSVRPPTRSRASRTTTERSAATRARAAARPGEPGADDADVGPPRAPARAGGQGRLRRARSAAPAAPAPTSWRRVRASSMAREPKARVQDRGAAGTSGCLRERSSAPEGPSLAGPPRCGVSGRSRTRRASSPRRRPSAWTASARGEGPSRRPRSRAGRARPARSRRPGRRPRRAACAGRRPRSAG